MSKLIIESTNFLLKKAMNRNAFFSFVIQTLTTRLFIASVRVRLRIGSVGQYDGGRGGGLGI